MDAQDYIKIFEQSPALVIVIDARFIIVAASDDFLKKTKITRELITGRDIFEVFPDNPNDIIADGEEKMRASFIRVIKNKRADTLPIVRYDIPKPASEGGGFEVKYWKVVNSPILDTSNNVKYIIQRSDDVTENETLVEQLDLEQKALKQIEDSEKRYNMMLMKSPLAFAVLKGKNMVITLANDSVKEIWGKGKDLEGNPLLEVLPETKNSEFAGLLDNVYTSGVPFCGEELLAPVFRNGKLEDVYFNFVYQPYLEADETISGVTIIAYEVTASVIVKKALEAQHEAEQKALKQVEESNKRYYEMLMESPFAFSVMKGKDMVITLANSLIKEFWGKGKDVEGKTLLEVLPEIKDQPFPEMIKKVYTTGIPVSANEILGIVTYNGQLIHKYFNVVFQPYYEADNSISGVTQIAYDVTETVLARKKIEESEKQLQAIFRHAPAAIAVLEGTTLNYVLANADYQKMTNRTEAQLVGKTMLEAFPELTGTGAFEIFENIFKTGEAFSVNEYPIALDKNNDGVLQHIYYKLRAEPIKDSEGKFNSIMVLAIDVTEQVNSRKKIEESEHRFEIAVAAVEGILWTNNAKGEMVGEQQGWASLTGQSYEDYQGSGWAKAIHPDDAQPTIDTWNQAVSESKNFIFEHRIRLKNRNWGNFSVRAVPSLNSEGLIQEWIGVHTDITEQRQTEKALQNAIHEQEEAKSKAEAAKLVAEDAMQAKQQFLSNMSHEIRTPMNAILGFTNVVLKSKLDEKQKEYLTAIKVSGDALLVLINDILDLAKVDAGKMTFEKTPFNLATSLSAMLQLFDIKTKKKNLELAEQFDIAIPEIIMGDPMRLRQIILNLISNAVKFTDAGKITLRVALLKQDAEKVTLEFTVTDTGIGIHKNKLEHIFDDFGQAAYENSRLYGGTGLGLTIVKKLIEQQGGTIHVESKLGKGSAFSFQLNFTKTNQKIKHETERVANKQTEIKNINVLVAEDMPLNQLLIKIILADFGFEVDIAGNGKIAIEKLQQKKYDLVLMDLQMPEMNGFDATAYVRNTMNSNIPIIALTADVTSIDVEKARAVGMNDYISKPIDEQLLYNKIIKVLQKTDWAGLAL